MVPFTNNSPKTPDQWRKVILFILIPILIGLAFPAGVIYFLLSRQAEPAMTRPPASLIAPTKANGIPDLHTELTITNLDHPWDMGFLPDGNLLYSQRNGVLSLFSNNISIVVFRPDDIFVSGEAGLLGLTVDTDFSSNHFVYVCFDSKLSPGNDVRVARLKLEANGSKVEERKDIVTGLPINVSGRHSGCRPRFSKDGVLWIGTGDSANATVAQNPKSLGGKILRVDREGVAVSGNLGAPFDPRIFSYGHRNIQGLALWPNGAIKNGSYGFSVEHGTGKDDELNELVPGNFGWDPIPAPYNEAVPMTNKVKFPSAIDAVWSSGDPTIAPSGASFISGSQWQALDGALAMAVLKDKYVKIFTFNSDKKIAASFDILQQFGRIRSIIQAPDGSLYFSTDNGRNQDIIARVTPAT